MQPFDIALGCCGGLNEIGAYRVTGSGTIRRCDLVGVVMILLEEVCHGRGWGRVGFEVSEA